MLINSPSILAVQRLRVYVQDIASPGQYDGLPIRASAQDRSLA